MLPQGLIQPRFRLLNALLDDAVEDQGHLRTLVRLGAKHIVVPDQLDASRAPAFAEPPVRRVTP